MLNDYDEATHRVDYLRNGMRRSEELRRLRSVKAAFYSFAPLDAITDDLAEAPEYEPGLIGKTVLVAAINPHSRFTPILSDCSLFWFRKKRHALTGNAQRIVKALYEAAKRNVFDMSERELRRAAGLDLYAGRFRDWIAPAKKIGLIRERSGRYSLALLKRAVPVDKNA